MAYMTLAANVGNGSASFLEVSSSTETSGRTTYSYKTYQFKATYIPGVTFVRWETRYRCHSYSVSGSGSETDYGTTEWTSWSSFSTDDTCTHKFLCSSVSSYGGSWGNSYSDYEHEVRAVFTQTTTNYTVTTVASPVAGGTTTGDGQYASGATCTVTAQPAQGYEFVRWELSTGDTDTSQSYSFTVEQNTTATAYFRQYTYMPLCDSSGTILCGSSGDILYDG